MNRRTVLKTGSMAALGFGFGGCAAPKQMTNIALPSRRPMFYLPPIRASWDRVIRTTVGLRPHRPTGFRLEAEKFDDKTVIHNYGHGGAGLSLSWGTGAMAADMALDAINGDRKVAVLGSGAVGLAATRQLQRRGFDVTIYTAAVPPHTTSNMAYGIFSPTSGLLSARRASAWEVQFRTAVEIAYRQLQLFAGANYGVSWMDSYGTMEELPTSRRQVSREPDTEGLLPSAIANMSAGREILHPGEHPFTTPYASRRVSMRIEPTLFLEAMLREVRLFGGRTVIRKFASPSDFMMLKESVIVNCTGLGARDIFTDPTLIPVKGQLTFLVPQPEVNYQFGCMPRSDGIALGSTRERGVWSMEPDLEVRQRIVDRAISRFALLRAPQAGGRMARTRPLRSTPSVDNFFDMES